MNDTEAQKEPKPKKPGGAPKGSANHFQHGAYSLLAMRTKGRPNGNTKLGRAFRARELEYLRDMGGEENTSLSERQLANDNAWCDFILSTVSNQMSRRKQFVRKGKPVPLIELWLRVAAHRRENYKLLGLQRRTKQRSLNEMLQADDQPATGNGDQDGKTD